MTWLDYNKPLSEEESESIASAINEAEQIFNANQISLVIPPELAMDAILNLCSYKDKKFIRAPLREFVEEQIRVIPWITTQERECIRAMAFQSPAEASRIRKQKGISCKPSDDN